MQKFIDGRLVEVGAQWNQPLSWPHLQIVVTCKGISPESFVGEVRMGGEVILATEALDDTSKAFRAADRAFQAKLLTVFRG